MQRVEGYASDGRLREAGRDGTTRLSRRRILQAGIAGGALALAPGPAVRAAAAAARCEPRYLGQRPGDEQLPYAKYFTDRVSPPQRHVIDALIAGQTPAAQVPLRRALAAELEAPGYRPIETGYGMTASGELWVACLTHMPRVEPRMWDWWFAWHSKESARYRLWHPEAHAYAGWRQDRTASTRLTDVQKYRGNTSYVDEYVGGRLQQLAISFTDPARFGIDVSRFDGTLICATVGTALAPVNVGLLAHQVRRVPGGAEMRSRFYLNVAGSRALDLGGIACAIRRGLVPPSQVLFDARFGAQLLRHCAEEMHHLAQFLPELYGEFGDRS